MKNLLPLLCWAFVPIIAGSAFAQTGDGYVGIYADSAGTIPCATVPPISGTTLYVIAKVDGASSGGITGAEFRIEVENPTGWWFSYTPPLADLVLGTALDLEPQNPNDDSGVNIAFGACREPVNSKIPMGTITVFNGTGSSTRLSVKRHSTPRNPGYPCPLFTLCDDPVFSKSCMTPAPPDSCTLEVEKATVSSVGDGAIFTASLNGESAGGGGVGPFPERQVIAMFMPGVIQLPVGQNGASLQSTSITSDSVAGVLQASNVEYIEKAFPSFSLADTVGTSRTGEVVHLANLSEVYVLRLPVEGSPGTLASNLSALTDVAYAEPDGVAEAASCTYSGACPATIECPNDPRFSDQWSLYNAGQTGGACDADIDAFEAWNSTTGSMNTRIGIIDSGVDAGHEDLQGKVSGDAGFGGTPTFDPEHGTHVAGIAAAKTNNGLGIAGVDQQGQIHSQRMAEADFSGIAAAVRDAVQLGGAQILNNSWTVAYSNTVRLAFRDVYMLNALSVAAMGNTGTTATLYPAGFPNMLAVGATDRNDVIWSNSTRGDHIDVSAPGVSIWSTVPASLYPQKYVQFNGTSMAAPHVSGTAGLLLAYGGLVGRTLYNDDLEQLIRLSAEDKPPSGWDNAYGTGRINAEAALRLLEFPYELTQQTLTGGTSVGNTDWYEVRFYITIGDPKPPEGTRYSVRRYDVRRTVTFPVAYQSTPNVWARGAATVGWKNEDPHFGEGWCEVVPGTLTPSGCTFRTYVYEVRKLPAGTPLGWWPAHPNNVTFAYTAHGQATVTDVSEGKEAESVASVRLANPNPLRRGMTMTLTLPSARHVRFELFDVAGRRVRVLQDGRLPAGRHVLAWNGVDDHGNMLSSGLYFARLQSGENVLKRKLAVLE